MLRTFKVYRFVIPNRREYRVLLRELEREYDFERVIFEVCCPDTPYHKKKAPGAFVKGLAAENTALQKQQDYWKFVYTPELIVSNLDANWEHPNPNGITEGITFGELDAFCGRLTRTKFSSVLVGFDGIPWFGEAVPATWGYQKAKSKYGGSYGGGCNYLSSSLIVSVIGFENRYTLFASFEVTPREGDAPLDETPHVERIEEMLGIGAREALTYYAPCREEDRAKWHVAHSTLMREYTTIYEERIWWLGELPHKIEHGTWCGEPKQNVSAETKRALARAMKDSLWAKASETSLSNEYDRFDRFGNFYNLWFAITCEGHQIQVGLVSHGKFYMQAFDLGMEFMLDTDDIPRFLENIVLLAERYVDALSEAYGRALDESGTLAYFHPELA
jgi:hypothetical protein